MSALVHIGYHKTATTWFQAVFYPAVTNAEYIPRADVQRALIQPRPFDFDAATAREDLRDAREGRLILCEEELSGNIHVGGLHGCGTVEFARRLRAVLPDAVVVLFHRPIVDHVASCYRQYVKKGGTLDPSAYVFGGIDEHRRPSFSLRHLDVRRLSAFYRTVFGAESVRVYDFGDFVADPRAFVASYAADVGLSFDSAAVDWDRRVNPGYGHRVVKIARLINLFTEERVANKRCLIAVPALYDWSRHVLDHLNTKNWLRGSSDPSAILGPEVVQRIRSEVEGWKDGEGPPGEPPGPDRTEP